MQRELAAQLRRAALSVRLNIAEGRGTPERDVHVHDLAVDDHDHDHEHDHDGVGDCWGRGLGA
ncbi:four helix bundle protein [Sorangium sp. So ce302]|uniref:four helix bundle protein n=1 Tax=Sorangium sp. So ce302 TaxID=3133297 RepID=UPI003F618AB0